MKKLLDWLLEGDVDFKSSNESFVGGSKIIVIELKDKRKFLIVNNEYVSFGGNFSLTSQCKDTELLVHHYTKYKFHSFETVSYLADKLGKNVLENTEENYFVIGRIAVI